MSLRGKHSSRGKIKCRDEMKMCLNEKNKEAEVTEELSEGGKSDS